VIEVVPVFEVQSIRVKFCMVLSLSVNSSHDDDDDDDDDTVNLVDYLPAAKAQEST
jgi:hypothetical protein